MSRDVHFINGHSQLISVAIMFYSPDTCGPYGSWGTRGWWNIGPGESAYVIDTDNRYFCYYAESVDGLTWSDNYGPVYVHQTAFDSCVSIGDNSPETRVIGMRELDLNINNWWRLTSG
jgi:uncharacterized membrane protein